PAHPPPAGDAGRPRQGRAGRLHRADRRAYRPGDTEEIVVGFAARRAGAARSRRSLEPRAARGARRPRTPGAAAPRVAPARGEARRGGGNSEVRVAGGAGERDRGARQRIARAVEAAGDGRARRSEAPRRPGERRSPIDGRPRRGDDRRRVGPLGRGLHRPLGARREERRAVVARSLAADRAALAGGAAPRVCRARRGPGRAFRCRPPARAARRRPGGLRRADRPATPAASPGDRMISTVEKVLFLKSIDLFRALPSEELAQIAEIAEEQPLAQGDQVFGEGEPGDALYLVVEGKVKVHKGEK